MATGIRRPSVDRKINLEEEAVEQGGMLDGEVRSHQADEFTAKALLMVTRTGCEMGYLVDDGGRTCRTAPNANAPSVDLDRCDAPSRRASHHDFCGIDVLDLADPVDKERDIARRNETLAKNTGDHVLAGVDQRLMRGATGVALRGVEHLRPEFGDRGHPSSPLTPDPNDRPPVPNERPAATPLEYAEEEVSV